MNTLAAWVLSLMVFLQPSAPWRDTYEKTAQAIADVSIESPLFDGQQGVERTASIVTIMAFRESSFRVNAIGDNGASVGLMQISTANLSQGVSRESVLSDPEVAVREGLRLMAISFRVCARKPLESKLGWFMWGRVGCEHRLDLSRWRMVEAKKLMISLPYRT